ncbi:hypothetical protein M9H77_21679 [Catharanthus roseus]|uniref:Uncharacterized protein n=1 Tax=Catharanthus roseus TaxID=4058 RepID=A0ACC0ASC2_CATRO|nr:hypothetical protein M9H77_21679 [Catharanthus roseus]
MPTFNIQHNLEEHIDPFEDYLQENDVFEAARLTEEQLKQTEQFRKSHVPPRNILRFFQEQNGGCVVSAQKIYNVVVKIKKNRMHRRNTMEEVLCLSAQRGYTIFYRKGEDSKVILLLHIQHQLQLSEHDHMY